MYMIVLCTNIVLNSAFNTAAKLFSVPVLLMKTTVSSYYLITSH